MTFIGKEMVNDYWTVCVIGIVNVFGIYYGYKIVYAFRIFIGKDILNDYWIVCVFGI